MENMDKNYPYSYICMKSMLEATAYGREDEGPVINFLGQNGCVPSRKHKCTHGLTIRIAANRRCERH